MNHTERIAHVSRQVRGLTREHARQAVELYLASVAEEAAEGGWVALPNLGRLRIGCHKNGGKLKNRISDAALPIHDAGFRIQARLHLNDEFKAACRKHLLPGAKLNAFIDRSTVTIRIEPEKPATNRVQPGQKKQR